MLDLLEMKQDEDWWVEYHKNTHGKLKVKRIKSGYRYKCEYCGDEYESVSL